MNLFNIAQERLALMAEIEANDGELSPEMEEALAINQADFDEKATAYFHMIRQTEGEQSAIDAGQAGSFSFWRCSSSSSILTLAFSIA